MEQSGYSETSVINYLQGISFPKTRQELIEFCQDEGAPEQILDVLGALPDREYISWEDLMEAAVHCEG